MKEFVVDAGEAPKELEEPGFRWDKFIAEQAAVVGPEGELALVHLAVTEARDPPRRRASQELVEGECRACASRP